MQTKVIPQYLYQQYQDDLDLKAFVDSFNAMAQGYIDWCNQIGIPIYTNLSGTMLDWIGASLYGLPRPITGNTSGAVYNAFKYNKANYGTGTVLSVLATDDVYKRILTWKTYRGDGFRMNLGWLKRRIKRFIIGINGTSPAIDTTSEVSITIGANNTLNINVHFPNDVASANLLVQYINSGVLDVPFQYTINAGVV